MADNNKKFYDKFIKKNSEKKINGGSASGKTENVKPQKKHRDTIQHKNKKTYVLKPDISKPNIFKDLTREQSKILNSFFDIANSVLKLGKQQEKESLKNIRDLFHELTDERGTRKVNYLNNPVKLSAYIFHYMWWNLFRLVKLFNGLEIELEDGSAAGDFGCGPLTAICALWIAKPELRNKKIIFYCTDISAKALREGEKIFTALCNFAGKESNSKYENAAWSIIKVNGEFGKPIKQKLSLYISANMFNEIFWDSDVRVQDEARKAARIITRYLKDDGKLIVVEPGIPLAGRFISSFRSFLLDAKYNIYSPCTHHGSCPLPFDKFDKNKKMENFCTSAAHDKWCHFSFSVKDAPPNLLKLSASAKLEKNTASLSFIFAGLKPRTLNNSSNNSSENNSLKSKKGCKNLIDIIITSHTIKLPYGKSGRYACSEKGFLLLSGNEKKDSLLQKCKPGSIFKLELGKPEPHVKDKKTNALVINIF